MRLFRLHRRKQPQPAPPKLAPLSTISTDNSLIWSPISPFTIPPQSAAESKLPAVFSINEQIDGEASPPRTMSSSPSRPQSSKDTQPAQRPKSAGHHNLRRPTLADILADKAPAPWTLAAFTRYAAQNLCDENIEFMTAARKYTEEYEAAKPDGAPADPATDERIRDVFEHLILTFVTPQSPREINIPGDIRSPLMCLQHVPLPPNPEVLKPAVAKVKELIEDSILFSFLNEVRPPSEISPAPSPITSTAQLRERTTASRLSGTHAKRFSTSVLEPAISFSPVFRKQRPSDHQIQGPTSNPGSATAYSFGQMAGLPPSASDRNSQHRLSQSRMLASKSSSASVSSASGFGAIPSLVEPALTDDSGLSIRSPVGSEELKSPPASDASYTPPDTPELLSRQLELDSSNASTRSSSFGQSQMGWRKMSARLSHSVGSLRKKRSESYEGTRSGHNSSTGSVEERPRIPTQQQHKNSTGSQVLLEEDE